MAGASISSHVHSFPVAELNQDDQFASHVNGGAAYSHATIVRDSPNSTGRSTPIAVPSYMKKQPPSSPSDEGSLDSTGLTASSQSFHNANNNSNTNTQQQPNQQQQSAASTNFSPNGRGRGSARRGANSHYNASFRNAYEGPFFVPMNTPCWVSVGDGNWHLGIWGDNERPINPLDYRALQDLATSGLHPAVMKDLSAVQTFIRHADVLLVDHQGNSMFMAANRKRPCLIRFPEGTWLYREEGRRTFVPISTSELL